MQPFKTAEKTKFCSERREQNKKALLLERAKKLAKCEKRNIDEGGECRLLLFALGSERYAIEASYVSEVYPPSDVTLLPSVPKWIYGLINVRRKIYSVVDLKSFFDLPEREESEGDKVIILEEGFTSFGILTQEIIGVEKLSTDNLQTQLPTFSSRCKEYLKGIADDRTFILDGYKLIHSEELVLSQH